jgi:hypothetical protein
MVKAITETAEARETVSYTLPRRLIDAVAMYAIVGRFTHKSLAAQDIIERGLRAIEREQEAA